MDVVIRAGSIIDGNGGEPYTADIGIVGDRIVAIGKITDAATVTIDADGATVTPGFIDPHTHYDGQAVWDSAMAPSSQHGVTTAVMGNCGVGFAPLVSGQQDVLVRLMQGVEDIPGSVLAEGLDWQWQTFADYLARLEAMPRTLNLIAQVPHDPLRLFVMGDRAERGEAATDEDIRQMASIVKQALLAGAWGFSTGRTDNHRMADGKDTPSAIATRGELLAIASVLRELPYRTLSAVSDFDMAHGPSHFEAEFALLEEMALAADRPLTLSWMQRLGAGEQWRQIGERALVAAARGAKLRLQCAARGIGTLLSLETTFNPLLAYPSYHRIMHLPLAARVAAIRSPEFLAALANDTPLKLSLADNSIPPAADAVIQNLAQTSRMMFPIDRAVNYEPVPSSSIFALAQANGRTVIEQLALALAAEDGHAFVYFPIYNYLGGNFAAIEQMLAHPLAQLGLGDAGAHVATISDGAYSTFLLSHWVRDRTLGPRLPLPRAIALMTSQIADHFRLADRGRLQVGAIADVNVIDLAGLRLGLPYVAADLPAGGKRILQDATGYLATLVAGQRTNRQDQLTAARPGKLLRAPA